MAANRPTPEIACIDCKATNVYGRQRDNVGELYCPDCGAVFGWANLPKECHKCGRRIWSKDERGKGVCSSCTVAAWTSEKKAAFSRLIGMGFRGDPKPEEAEIDSAIDEAFKHLGETKTDGQT